MSSIALHPTAESYAPPADLGGRQRTALVVGLVGAAVLAAGAFTNTPQFFRSYLTAFLFWFGIALGSLGLQMLHHLTGGAWGLVIRRILEAAARTLPFVGLLFLPVAFGLGHIYTWADAAKVAADPVLQHKAPYLNVPFFLARAVAYFVIWGLFAYLLSKWSLRQDQGDGAAFQKMKALSGGGLVVYCLTLTTAIIDWLMSLDPHWFSSIYGVYALGGQGISTLAFVILVASWLVTRAPMASVLQPRHFHDIGKLMFAFTMLWTYFCLSQFLIVWSGSLPEETIWYAHRLAGGWQIVAVAIVLFHFALPFLLLLSRDLKRNARTLSRVALLLLFMRFVDTYWQAAPNFHHSLAEGLQSIWLDLAAWIGIGGIWLAVFYWQLGRRSLLPIHDPNLPEALASGGHHG
jgi:hypothetical protein